jgi:hypothetical protein
MEDTFTIGIVDDPIDSSLVPVYCHEAECYGYTRGFLAYEETEMCPFCSGTKWSLKSARGTEA